MEGEPLRIIAEGQVVKGPPFGATAMEIDHAPAHAAAPAPGPGPDLWAPIPGFDGYDIHRGTRAVRSWRKRFGGKADTSAKLKPFSIKGHPSVTLMGPQGKPLTRTVAALHCLTFPEGS